MPASFAGAGPAMSADSFARRALRDASHLSISIRRTAGMRPTFVFASIAARGGVQQDTSRSGPLPRRARDELLARGALLESGGPRVRAPRRKRVRRSPGRGARWRSRLSLRVLDLVDALLQEDDRPRLQSEPPTPRAIVSRLSPHARAVRSTPTRSTSWRRRAAYESERRCPFRRGSGASDGSARDGEGDGSGGGGGTRREGCDMSTGPSRGHDPQTGTRLWRLAAILR